MLKKKLISEIDLTQYIPIATKEKNGLQSKEYHPVFISQDTEGELWIHLCRLQDGKVNMLVCLGQASSPSVMLYISLSGHMASKEPYGFIKLLAKPENSTISTSCYSRKNEDGSIDFFIKQDAQWLGVIFNVISFTQTPQFIFKETTRQDEDNLINMPILQ